jgi:hypothetical protein
MDLPAHPEADDDAGAPPSPTTGRLTWLVAVVIVALLAVMVVLHLTGAVGPN